MANTKYLDESWLRKEYSKSKSVVKIAKKCRVAVTTVSRWLENFEIRKKRDYKGNKSGSNNSFWGGGKYKESSGYIMVHSPNHPCATKKGYVREHRLVMESCLGRHLRKNEIVHHRNKNKDDNRIENLELIIVGEVNGGDITCPHCSRVFKLS